MESSIITSPNNNISLEKETRLIKCALLYSDTIHLISPNLTLLLYCLRVSGLTEKERIFFFKSLESLNGENYEKLIQTRNYLMNQKNKPQSEIIRLEKIKLELKKIDKTFEKYGEDLFMQSGLPEFNYLIENGTINLKHLDPIEEKQKMPIQILDETIQVLSNPSVYPIFDSLIENLASAYINETEKKPRVVNANEVYVGKDFLLKLPNIDKLHFSDIIKLKAEMSVELKRFKGLIYEYSKEIDGLVFEKRDIIDKRYEYEFLPELNDIQERIDSNSFIKHIIKDIGENFSTYAAATSAICCTVTSWTQLEASLVSAAGIGPTLLQSTIKSINLKSKEDNDLKKNRVYFYHKLMNL